MISIVFAFSLTIVCQENECEWYSYGWAFALRVEGRWFDPGQVKSKTKKLTHVTFKVNVPQRAHSITKEEKY